MVVPPRMSQRNAALSLCSLLPGDLSVEPGAPSAEVLRTVAWLAGQRGAPQDCGTEM